MSEYRPFISVIIPAYNASGNVGICLEALLKQTYPKNRFEVIVVDDGSSDDTVAVVEGFDVKLLKQTNQGAGVARNYGAKEAKGEIILFTDSDCEPEDDWIEKMVEPFNDTAIVGGKGFYKTKQRKIIPRFAQLEYDAKCDMLKKERFIDFIDTYSAAYRKDVFLKVGGFDAVYTTASGEDSELSYKLALMNYKMVPVPNAFVYHIHPDTLWKYLKKKYRNAYWRVVTWKKYPSKVLKDSHTPNSYKFEVLMSPFLLLLIIASFFWTPIVWALLICVILFILNELNFLKETACRDVNILFVVPFLLFLRGLSAAYGAFVKIFELILQKA